MYCVEIFCNQLRKCDFTVSRYIWEKEYCVCAMLSLSIFTINLTKKFIYRITYIFIESNFEY